MNAQSLANKLLEAGPDDVSARDYMHGIPMQIERAIIHDLSALGYTDVQVQRVTLPWINSWEISFNGQRPYSDRVTRKAQKDVERAVKEHVGPIKCYDFMCRDWGFPMDHDLRYSAHV